MNQRELPHNISAERSVLAAMILDEECLHTGIETLDTNRFAFTRHRHLFEALRALFEEQALIDAINLGEKLSAQKHLGEAGGVEYLLDLIGDVASPSTFTHHLRIVEDKFLLRELIETSRDITTQAYAGTDEVNNLIDKAESMMFEVASKRERGGLVHISKFIGDVYEQIEIRSEQSDEITGVETGYPVLDGMINGLQPAEFIVLAARPGQGKTALVLNIMQYAAVKKQIPVAFFSLEMAREALAIRLLCAEAKIDGVKIRSGRIPPEFWSPLTQALADLSQSPIYIDDTPAMTILEMRAKARRAKSQQDIQLIIIDYLQLMHGSRHKDGRQQEVSEISGFLKALSKELGIPVLACAQLSRAQAQRPSKEPVLTDLRESGAIEQDADVVLFIHHPKNENEDEEENEGQYYSDCELLVAKNRNGPVGRVPLRFVRKYTRFEHRADDDFASGFPTNEISSGSGMDTGFAGGSAVVGMVDEIGDDDDF